MDFCSEWIHSFLLCTLSSSICIWLSFPEAECQSQYLTTKLKLMRWYIIYFVIQFPLSPCRFRSPKTIRKRTNFHNSLLALDGFGETEPKPRCGSWWRITLSFPYPYNTVSGIIFHYFMYISIRLLNFFYFHNNGKAGGNEIGWADNPCKIMFFV